MELLSKVGREKIPGQDKKQEIFSLLADIKSKKEEIDALRNKPEGLNTPGLNDASAPKNLDQIILDQRILELIALEKEMYQLSVAMNVGPGRFIDPKFAEYLAGNNAKDDGALLEARKNLIIGTDPAMPDLPMNSLFIPQKPPH